MPKKIFSNVLNATEDIILKLYANGNVKEKSSKEIAIPSLADDILQLIETMNEKSIPVNCATVIPFSKVIIANKKYKMYLLLPASRRKTFSEEGWLTKALKRTVAKS